MMIGQADLCDLPVVEGARKVAFGRAVHDNVENHVRVIGVDRVVVLLPTGCSAIYLDRATVFASIELHGGADKIPDRLRGSIPRNR
jgi:hypothetical protein